MNAEKSTQDKTGGVSKVKLALGAASLFLFIVGVKRTFRADDSPAGTPIRDEKLRGRRKRAEEDAGTEPRPERG